MTTALRTGLGLVSLGLLLAFTPAPADAQDAPADKAAGGQKLSGPYTCENLSIFLVHGPSTLKGEFMTLEEALAAKQVTVHETGEVNELSIENTGTVAVYVQSGEVVKGGKQDRTLGSDITLAPKSGKVPIAAFCVEHGRWQQRGEESAALFNSSDSIVVGNAAKLASNQNYAGGGGQQKVWDEVAAKQKQLSRSVAADVAAASSPSSLQLSLEHPKVRETVEQYVAKVKASIAAEKPAAKEGGDDVIGYAVAINGKVVSADVYGSSALFAKLWPKLLRSAATEAAAERPADAKAPIAVVSEGHVYDLLRDAETAKGQSKDVNESISVTTAETKQSVMFESRQKDADGYLHRSYLSK